MKRYIRRASIAAICAVVVLSGCSRLGMKPAPTDQSEITQTQQPAAPTVVLFEGTEGTAALDGLKAGHEVKTKTFAGVGEFVEAIDGLAGDEGHFWAFYVNGEQASVGAGSYIVKKDDKLEFRYEEMKAYK